MFVATNEKRVYNQCDKNREDVMMKKPTVLMILDGYGLNERKDHNAVAEANTPVMDKLMAECPFVKGNASGMAVGLPEGQMGNSEVGHMNMGAGRIVYQELTRITKEIQDGTFAKKWLLENQCGRPQFNAMRRRAAATQAEQVGAQLRGMMSFLKKKYHIVFPF